MGAEGVAGLAEELIGRLPDYPGGDPEQLRAAATQWDYAGHQLQEHLDTARARVDAARGTWDHDARVLFDQRWDELTNAVEHGTGQLADVATALRGAADGIEAARLAYDVAIAGAATMGVFALFSAVASFGASEVAVLARLIEELMVAIGIAEETAAIAAAALETAMQAVRLLAINFATDLAGQAAMSMVVYDDHNPVGHLQPGDALATALGGAMIGRRRSPGRKP
ncbi:WXG100 family type VII secretion target [Dactylosporangium sp. McL0621]|uniref:WXG100 family type VII secretion target n=1 Tax=Dactylosporangium sp. McL0621 TaxID=3415678 RepID=UPI003CEFA34C